MRRLQSRKALHIDTPSRNSIRQFHRLAENYYEETFARFPIDASQLGREEFDAEMDSPQPETYESQARLTEKTLAAIEGLPANNFSADDWLDRRALLSELRSELMDLRSLQTWRTDPDDYAATAIESVYHLVVKNSDNLKRVVPAIESRLRKIPAYLDEAAATVRRPVPLWVKLAHQTCDGVSAFLDALPDQLAANSNKPREHWTRLTDAAKRAFARYADRVSAKPTGPAAGYCVGRERFEFLIRERLGLSITAREAEAIARNLVTKLSAELLQEARRFSKRKSAREILDDAAQQWRPREKDLLAEYQRVTAEVRERFEAARAMTFPRHDSLLIKVVPEFLRHQFPTAAYLSPGPYEKKQLGIFWVNDLSVTRKTEKEKRAEIAQHFGLELTAAHEAYPGHHLQFVTQNRHPSRWRRLFGHSIYYEGWTLWVEQMTIDLKIARGNPYARLAQLHDALWRAHRILVDCGLHTGTMDYRAACRHLQRHVGFTRARAEGDVNWYTASPTVPMSYLLGKLEVLRLKRLRVDEGGWSLKRFNDWILSFGAVPWSWIEASGE